MPGPKIQGPDLPVPQAGLVRRRTSAGLVFAARIAVAAIGCFKLVTSLARAK
jgi:hypothetical protein